jgi:hypothetical protein
MRKNTVWATDIVLVMVMPMLFWACAAVPSHFKRSYNISQTFEKYKIMPGYQYYLNGLPHSPNAVVAVKDEYRLNSEYWQPVKMDEKRLRRVVERMLNKPGSEYNTEPNGARIFDSMGKPIGAWYSVWALPQLTFISDKAFSISRPPVSEFPLSNRDPEERRLFLK